MIDKKIDEYPIFNSILLALGKDPSTGEYNPMASDIPYLISHIPEEERKGDVTLDEALKYLENQRLITKMFEDTYYFNLASKGRPLVNTMIDEMNKHKTEDSNN